MQIPSLGRVVLVKIKHKYEEEKLVVVPGLIITVNNETNINVVVFDGETESSQFFRSVLFSGDDLKEPTKEHEWIWPPKV